MYLRLQEEGEPFLIQRAVDRLLLFIIGIPARHQGAVCLIDVRRVAPLGLFPGGVHIVDGSQNISVLQRIDAAGQPQVAGRISLLLSGQEFLGIPSVSRDNIRLFAAHQERELVSIDPVPEQDLRDLIQLFRHRAQQFRSPGRAVEMVDQLEIQEINTQQEHMLIGLFGVKECLHPLRKQPISHHPASLLSPGGLHFCEVLQFYTFYTTLI